MPRTKYVKKTSKRSRGRDDRLEEFDSIAHSYLDALEETRNTLIQDLTEGLNTLKSKMPVHVLNMSLNELRALQLNTIQEIGTPVASSSRESKTDDGYVTGRSTRSRTRSRDTQGTIGRLHSKDGRSGPLQSASKVSNGIMRPLHSVSKGTPAVSSRVTNRRRSRSVDSNNGMLMPRTGMKRMTPMNQHVSRSKFRESGRKKAASADRYIITPKVQPGTPLAVLRHANVGESVFSLKGSPVLSSNIADYQANVNIPIGNGYLSLRPTQVDTISPSYLRRIDTTTMKDLKQLQENLNRLMAAAGVSQD